MTDIIINYNDDKDDLKRMNHGEPVIELSTEFSYAVIPASKICYDRLKLEIDRIEEHCRYFKKQNSYQ